MFRLLLRLGGLEIGEAAGWIGVGDWKSGTGVLDELGWRRCEIFGGRKGEACRERCGKEKGAVNWAKLIKA